MEVFIHLPKTPKGKAELAKELAIFHAEHAQKMIQQLPCPVDQKLEILDAVVKEARRKDA